MLCWRLQEDTTAWHANCIQSRLTACLLNCHPDRLSRLKATALNMKVEGCEQATADVCIEVQKKKKSDIKPNRGSWNTQHKQAATKWCRGMQRNNLGGRNYEGHMLEFKVVEQSEINTAISVKLQEDLYFTRSSFQASKLVHWPSHLSPGDRVKIPVTFRSTGEDSREAVC